MLNSAGCLTTRNIRNGHCRSYLKQHTGISSPAITEPLPGYGSPAPSVSLLFQKRLQATTGPVFAWSHYSDPGGDDNDRGSRVS